MKIAIAAEGSSFRLKQLVKTHLVQLGHEVMDVGMIDEEYPKTFYEVAPKVAEIIQSGKAERGVLMCGTGMGVCLIANKFKGVYACYAESATTAELHYIVNQANVLCFGEQVVGSRVALDMVDRWLNAKAGEGFEEDEQQVLNEGLQRMKEIENTNFR